LKESNKLQHYFKRISSKIMHKKHWNNSKNIIGIRNSVITIEPSLTETPREK